MAAPFQCTLSAPGDGLLPDAMRHGCSVLLPAAGICLSIGPPLPVAKSAAGDDTWHALCWYRRKHRPGNDTLTWATHAGSNRGGAHARVPSRIGRDMPKVNFRSLARFRKKEIKD